MLVVYTEIVQETQNQKKEGIMGMESMIEMVVAMANDNVIGYKGTMPWERIPRDLAHFKKITEGHTVVMGYKTLVAIGGALPKRTNLVLTNDPEKTKAYPGCLAVSGVGTILELAKREKVFIIGGEVVYREFLDHASVIHLTKIQSSFDGDTHFPWLSPDEWRLARYAFHRPDEKNKYPITFQTWVRRESMEEKMAA